MAQDQTVLQEIDQELTALIRTGQDYMMEKIRIRLGEDSYSFQRFNGLFGGKNNIYVDSVRTQFTDFNDFYSRWLKGVVDHYEERLSLVRDVSDHNAVLLKDSEIEAYVRLFLERNFYRNLKERTRAKPQEQLWSIWFGYNIIFGLLIAPKHYDGEWYIDKSEIRRVNYKYWTLGHVFAEGLIDHNSVKAFKIKNLDQFEAIYSMIFRQLSNSIYEKRIFDRYIDYLKSSKNVSDEPFMIPELRYGGLDKKHKYRIDFTILNPHTMEYIGIEISPASSHMSVANLKEKQVEVNKELSAKWDKEMQKRNDYFREYEITILTFTDQMLVDFDSCWKIIEQILSRRPSKDTNIKNELQRIRLI